MMHDDAMQHVAVFASRHGQNVDTLRILFWATFSAYLAERGPMKTLSLLTNAIKVVIEPWPPSEDKEDARAGQV